MNFLQNLQTCAALCGPPEPRLHTEKQLQRTRPLDVVPHNGRPHILFTGVNVINIRRQLKNEFQPYFHKKEKDSVN